jgi:voltage-gated potassium channel
MAKSVNESIRIKYRKKILTVVFLIAGIIMLGIAGFIVLENFSFIEAFYTTISIFGTIGFSASKPLDNTGKLFTTLLILLNLGIFAFAITSITNFIAEGDIKKYLQFRRVQKGIAKLSGHIIVCGYGRNGKQVCEVLTASNNPFVIVEKEEKQLEGLHNNPGALFIIGDSTDDEILMEAGINKAKALITTLPKDPDNVYVVLTAKEMNPDIHIISRASDESSEVKLKRAGADNVIMPEKIGGSYMASLILRPHLTEFISTLTGHNPTNFEFEEIPCAHIAAEDKILKDLQIFKQFKVLVIGLKNPAGTYSYNPAPNSHISKGTSLIVLGAEEHIRNMRASLGKAK